MCLARLPLTSGTTVPLVSYTGSEVSVSCPCIRLQAIGLQALCSGPVLIDEPAQMTAAMSDMMECRLIFSLGGWPTSGPHMQQSTHRLLGAISSFHLFFLFNRTLMFKGCG